MRATRLLPLAAFLAILVVAGLLLKRQPVSTRLSEEVGWTRLVPQSLRTDSINGVDLYQGAQPDDVVRLRRHEGEWVLVSYFDAPVKATKIQEFLDTISTLEGELRSDQDELLTDFRLAEAQALHLQIYTDSPETAAVHLLAGKSNGRNSFMRVADETRVYSVNLNVHREAGLGGNNTEKPPEAKPWLDLQIQDVPKEQVSAVELHTPVRRLRLTLQKPDPPAVTDTPQADSDQEASATPRWTLSEPDVAYTVKQEPVDSLVKTLRTLRGEDVTDAAKAAAYGLDEPLYRALLSLQSDGQEARQVAMLFGNEVPEQAGKRYARLGQGGPIYIVPKWSFESLFPKAKDLLELPSLRLQDDEMQQIALFLPGKTVRLTRPKKASQTDSQDDEPAPAWTLTEPRLPFAVRQSGVETLARRLATFTPDDLATVPDTVPSVSPESLPRAEMTLYDTSRHLLQLGAPFAASPPQYALSMSGQTTPFAIDEETRKQLFPDLSTLLELHVLRVQPQDVTRLTWQQGEESWSLERRTPPSPMASEAAQVASGVGPTSTAWYLANAPQASVDEKAVASLLKATTQLTADDWIEHPPDQMGQDQPALTLALTLRDGHTEHLTLGQPLDEDGGGHYANRQGIPGLFVVSAATYKALLEPLSTLRASTAASAPIPSQNPP